MQAEKNVETKSSKREQIVIERLKKEFIERSRKNPSYSMRAFAASLKVDQSHLSKIFSGKLRISEKMIFHLSSILDINPSEFEGRLNYDFIEDTSFEVISNWVHFAILELLKTEDFRSDTKWMAKRLQVSIMEVSGAVERLVQIGAVKKNQAGEIEPTNKNLEWNNSTKTTLARKTLQKEYLKKAITCIDVVDFADRENSSLTLSVPADMMPELKKEILKFKNRIDRLCEAKEQKTQVYQLCLALFPLTELKENSHV